MCDKVVCDKDVCDKDVCVCDRVVCDKDVSAAEAEAEERDTESKTRTPHALRFAQCSVRCGAVGPLYEAGSFHRPKQVVKNSDTYLQHLYLRILHNCQID